MSVFDGTQPYHRQSPPRRSRSTSATLAPSVLPPAATTGPPEPPPITTRSNSGLDMGFGRGYAAYLTRALHPRCLRLCELGVGKVEFEPVDELGDRVGARQIAEERRELFAGEEPAHAIVRVGQVYRHAVLRGAAREVGQHAHR